MRILFVVNPGSGPGQKDWTDIINEFFLGKEHAIDFFLIEKNTDCKTGINKKIKDFKPERVVATGGDGTVKLVAEILLDHSALPMGIIPAGSANGMARELDIPDNIDDALKLTTNGKASTLDMIKVNNEWCIHLSDIGLNAKMLEHFEQTESRGMFGYAKAVFRMFGKKTYMKINIKTDKEELTVKAPMIVIANASKYGTGVVINPKGHVNDGLFEIVIVHQLEFFELIKMLFIKRSIDTNKATILTCQTMELTAGKAYPFQVDGEFLGKTKKIKAEIKNSAIRVILPVE